MSIFLRGALVPWMCAASMAQDTATFRSRVEVVTVPVVVRDKKGNAVGSLKQEDFELFDQGKRQVISRFSVEKTAGEPLFTATATPGGNRGVTEISETPTVATPTRFVGYVFDDVHADGGDLQSARDAALKHIQATLRTTDRAAIFTTSGVGMVDFTTDLDKIHKALFALLPRSRQSGHADCPTMTHYEGDLIQNRRDMRALNLATDEAQRCDPGVDRPTARQMALDSAQRTLITGDMETLSTLRLLGDLVRRLSMAPGDRMLVLASPGFLITDDYRPWETELMERAIRANVIISAVNAHGLMPDLPSDDMSENIFDSAATSPVNQKAQQKASANSNQNYPSGVIGKTDLVRGAALSSDSTLGEIADATGGSYYHNNNDPVEGFRRVDSAPEYIYVLEFAPRDLKQDGKLHPLRVTVRNSHEYHLEARRSYYAPKPADSVQQTKREVRAALFSRDELRDIPVELDMAASSHKLDVIVRADIRGLHYRKVEGREVDTLSIVAGCSIKTACWLTILSGILR
jgi:VWFA-related protein